VAGSSRGPRAERALNPEQVHGAARHPEDGHVNPAKLGAAFARSAQRAGARILTGVAVRELRPAGSATRAVTDRGTVEASHVVVTTGVWSKEFAGFLGVHVPVEPARGQLLATVPAPPLLSHAVFNTYGLLQTAGGSILAGGNVEFAGFAAEPCLETHARIRRDSITLLPALEDFPLTHSWARFRPHTPDELPLLGFCGSDGRHLIAAGHFKNGLLLSAVSGRIVADLLTRGATPYPLAGVEPDRFRHAEDREGRPPAPCEPPS
jgi:glycine oxidase